MRRWQEWYAVQKESLERRQRAAVERGGEGSAAGVGDLGAVEVEQLELRQHSSRRTCRRRRRRHEGGEALVAERVAMENETLQRGPPPQGRRQGPQPRVADGGVVQSELLIYCKRRRPVWQARSPSHSRYSECNIRIRAPSGILPTNPHDLLRPNSRSQAKPLATLSRRCPKDASVSVGVHPELYDPTSYGSRCWSCTTSSHTVELIVAIPGNFVSSP